MGHVIFNARIHFSFIRRALLFQLSSLETRSIILLWGLNNMPKICVYDIMTMGLVYPLSEHVDIFPVRLVPTFPLSILRLPYIYLT